MTPVNPTFMRVGREYVYLYIYICIYDIYRVNTICMYIYRINVYITYITKLKQHDITFQKYLKSSNSYQLDHHRVYSLDLPEGLWVNFCGSGDPQNPEKKTPGNFGVTKFQEFSWII